MMYIGGDVAIIQGKFPHAIGAPRDVPLQELSFKKDSYQYDTNSCMMFKTILSTWHKRDLNETMHDDNMSIPLTYNKGISNKTSRIMKTSTSHRWFCITSSRNHEIE